VFTLSLLLLQLSYHIRNGFLRLPLLCFELLIETFLRLFGAFVPRFSHVFHLLEVLLFLDFKLLLVLILKLLLGDWVYTSAILCSLTNLSELIEFTLKHMFLILRNLKVKLDVLHIVRL
jgi:hypothetical protein